MYFDAIAKVISERTGCEVSTVKPESTFTELGQGLLGQDLRSVAHRQRGDGL